MESHVTALGLQDWGRGRGWEHLGCRVPSVRWMGRLSKLWDPEKSLGGPQAESRSGFLEPVLCPANSQGACPHLRTAGHGGCGLSEGGS